MKLKRAMNGNWNRIQFTLSKFEFHVILLRFYNCIFCIKESSKNQPLKISDIGEVNWKWNEQEMELELEN